MKKLITSEQCRAADQYTIQQQGINSLRLMEQAAEAFVSRFCTRFPDRNTQIAICCGPGNNGGDGMAIARLLLQQHYQKLKVYDLSFNKQGSVDKEANKKRLVREYGIVEEHDEFAKLNFRADIIIDAIFGSGFNKDLQGPYLAAVEQINLANAFVVAVDVPSGFKCEGELSPSSYQGVRADWVLCFQRPKINFFFPESGIALKDFEVLAIGLDEAFIQSQESNWLLIDEDWVRDTLQPRKRFSHKGTYGHGLLLAGNTHTMGAALLASSAAIASGIGLLTTSVPEQGLTALNVGCAEAMFLSREEVLMTDQHKFNAMAIGPGLGLGQQEAALLKWVLGKSAPCIVDADALFLLSQNKSWLENLTADSILCPHVKEFDRLFGLHTTWHQRLNTATQQAQTLQIIIILKNQYTFVCLPDGTIAVNTSGNPAMAQGGMGDVLTGLLLSLLAQGYTAAEAAMLAVFVHGSAGDSLAKQHFVVSASKLAHQLSITLKKLFK